MDNTNFDNRKIIRKPFLIFGLVIVPLYFVISLVNHHLYEILIEFTIIIVAVIFAIVGFFTALRMVNNILSKLSTYVFSYTVFLLIHIFSSEQVNLFNNPSASFSLNCWIIANIVLALGFLFSVLDVRNVFKATSHLLIVASFSVISYVLTYYDILPPAMVDSQITFYGIIIQLVPVVIYSIVIFFWLHNKVLKSNRDLDFVFISIVGLLISEVILISQFNSSDLLVFLGNTIRHVSLLILLYKIFVINLVQPYDNLKLSFLKDIEVQSALKLENAETLRRFKRSQSIGHVASWEIDIKTNQMWASDEAFKIYGFKKTKNNTVPVDLPHSIVEKTDKPKLEYALRSLIERGVPYDVYFVVNLSNNTHKHLHSVATLKYKDGVPDKVYGVVMDITELSNEQAKLRYTSYHDHLTGIYNRRYFMEQRKFLDNKKYYPLACVLLDINGLKIINDSFGHKAGNRVLRKVAQILEETKKNQDCFVARIGGDEFSIICPNTSLEEAEMNIQQVLEKFNLEKVGNITLSVAYGVSIKTEADQSFDDILTTAENEMYMNKISSSLSFSNKIIDSLLNTLFEKELIAEAHSSGVSKLSQKLATALDLSPKKINDISMIARIHDIGKIGIPENIVNKPGTYTLEEYDIIKTHSEKGYKIIKSLSGMDLLANHILHHHERWDGKGYPSGLKGEEISVEARILAVCDAFDAMTNERTYKDKLSIPQAIKELKKGKGKQFDPAIVDVFLREVLNNEADE